MITIRTYQNKQWLNYYIYENEYEFRKIPESFNLLYLCTDLNKVKIGDYILTNNGYYVPVINVYKRAYQTGRSYQTKLYERLFIQTPLKKFVFYIKDNKINTSKNFSWTRLTLEYHNSLSIKEKLIACHLSKGRSPVYAYSQVYKGAERNPTYIYHRVNNLLNRESFINYLKKVGGFKMSNKLKDLGLDKENRLEIMKKKLEDPKCPPATFSFIMNYLEKMEKSASDPIDRSLEHNDSRFIATSNDIEIKNKLEKQGLVIKEDKDEA